MHNTIDDVTLANISREINYFHDFVEIQNKNSSPFPSRGMFLALVLTTGAFSVSSSYQNVLIKRSVPEHC